MAMNQYLSKTEFIRVFVCACHSVLARATPGPVRCFQCTRLFARLLNSREQMAAPSNSDACLPSDPLTGRVRSPAQRVLAALTAAEAGPGDHGRHHNAGRGGWGGSGGEGWEG